MSADLARQTHKEKLHEELLSAFCCAAGAGISAPAGAQPLFNVTNLVTDNQAVNAAVISDSTATNSWGISLTATSPFWIGAEGSHSANVYTVTSTGSVNNVTKSSIHVTIPNAGTVTGTVSNGNTAAFNDDSFLFVSQDGTVSGWRERIGDHGHGGSARGGVKRERLFPAPRR